MRAAAPSALSAGFFRSFGSTAPGGGQKRGSTPPDSARIGVSAPPSSWISGEAQILRRHASFCSGVMHSFDQMLFGAPTAPAVAGTAPAVPPAAPAAPAVPPAAGPAPTPAAEAGNWARAVAALRASAAAAA